MSGGEAQGGAYFAGVGGTSFAFRKFDASGRGVRVLGDRRSGLRVFLGEGAGGGMTRGVDLRHTTSQRGMKKVKRVTPKVGCETIENRSRRDVVVRHVRTGGGGVRSCVLVRQGTNERGVVKS